MASRIDPQTDPAPDIVAHRWEWTMTAGVVLALAGVLSIAAPGFTTVAITVLLAWVLIFVGIAGIVIGVRSRSVHRRWTDILYGAASLLVGLFILVDPVAGAASLTLVFAVWLAFRGSIELGGARRVGPGRLRGMLIVTGLVDWVLAIMLFLAFPFPAVQMLGVFVGVSLLLGGAVTILAAWHLREAGGA
jgi:uncharacterized membrane protein HdeD (DUF308 family)